MHYHYIQLNIINIHHNNLNKTEVNLNNYKFFNMYNFILLLNYNIYDLDMLKILEYKYIHY